MPIPDYATWLTKAQAAEALHVSTKTIEKYAQARQIEQALYRRPTGGPKLAVYNPADVERLRHPAPAAPFVVPAATSAVRTRALAPVNGTPPGGEDLARFADVLRTLALSEPRKSETTVFLTLDAAAAFTGLTVTRLRRQCQQGTLPAIKDHGWKIRRADLANL